MRSRLGFLAFLFATACSPASPADQAAAANAKEQARALVDCFVSGDFRKMAAKTLPAVVDGMGGAEAMARRIEAGMKQGPAIEGVEVSDAAVHRRSPTIYAFVPFTLKVHMADGTRAKNSHLLGVSNDGGTVWHFVDCAGLSRDNVRKVLPDFPSDLTLPTVR